MTTVFRVSRSRRLAAAIAYTCALMLTAACEIHVDIVDSGVDGGYPADAGDTTDGGDQQRCKAGEFDNDGRPETPCVAYTICRPGQYVTREASATADRLCSACKSGSFSSENNAAACALWSNCAAGQQVTNSPSPTEDRVCAKCAAGTITRGQNEANCYPPGKCLAGSEKMDDSDACEPCAAGMYCPGGSSPRETCADGRWDHDANPASECAERTLCLAGQHVASEGDANNDRQCAACTSGSVSTEINSPSCGSLKDCQPGQYITFTGSSTADRACAECGANGFSMTVNATSCLAFRVCEAGSYALQAGTKTSDRVCDSCNSGFFSTSANNEDCREWSHCQPGTHVKVEPSTTQDRVCEACGDGTTTIGMDWSVCVAQDQCAAGTFQVAAATNEAPAACDECLAGHFCAGADNVQTLCDGDTWDHDMDPATACATRSACVAGEYVTDDGNAVTDRTCSPCPPGTFTPGRNEHECTAWTECGPGTYVSQQGGSATNRVCSGCPEGAYSAASNLTACTRHTDCLPGQRVSVSGSATRDRSCAGCSSGSFSASANASECQTWATCDPGNYATNTPSDTTDRSCLSCANGTMSQQANQSSCLAVGACQPGFVETEPGSSTSDPVCAPCEAGTYCAGDKAPVMNCADGTWDHDGNAATSCATKTLCTTGQFISAAGSNIIDRSCSDCAAGSFSTASNVSNCTSWLNCSPGNYVSHAGDSKTDRSCAACAQGSFSTNSNTSSCTAFSDCPAGQRVSAAGTPMSDRTCTGCAAGSFSSVANATSCSTWSSCPAGRYVSAAGTATSDRVCLDCGAGSYSTQNNVSECADWTNCHAGKHVSMSGSKVSDRSCEACDDGTFSIADNSLSCTSWRSCEEGSYVSMQGSSSSDRMCTTWRDCGAGTFVTAAGSSTMDRSCGACDEGKFSSATNASACASWSSCAAGSYVSTNPTAANDRGCSPCASGTYSTSSNVGSCTGYTPCGQFEEVSVPGTSTTNQQCAAVPAPQPNFLWLDATADSTVIRNGSNVTEWRDRSGQNRHATVPNNSVAPTWHENGGPAAYPEIEFNGSDVRLQTASVQTVPEMTFFVLFNWSAPQQWGSIINQGHDQYYSIRQSDVCCGGNDNLNWHVRNRNDAPLLPPNFGAYQLLTVMQGADKATIYYDLNDEQTTLENNIDAGNAPITIGNAMTATQSMGGSLVEIRAFDYALSRAQRHAVEAQLKTKYLLGYTSCAEILGRDPDAEDGRYTIDPDGYGGETPITVDCDMNNGGWTIISDENFTSGAPGWDPATTSSCGSFGDILGGVGMFDANVTASKTFDLRNLAHTKVRVRMDFIKIGEWDNENGRVYVAGQKLWDETFAGNDGPNSQCGGVAPEQSSPVDVMLDHSSNSVIVSVSSTLDSDDNDESFAIDNVVVMIK